MGLEKTTPVVPQVKQTLQFPFNFGAAVKTTPVEKSKIAAPLPKTKLFSAPIKSKAFSTNKVKIGTDPKGTAVPVLQEYKQNMNGSLRGTVRNSSKYRDGTIITITPVQMKGIKPKAGMIVKTVSGSSYKLESRA
jgi:hypothetical protein